MELASQRAEKHLREMIPASELRNHRVCFHIGDISVPSRDEVLEELYSDALMEGQVIDLTTGADDRMFAVIRVDRLSRPLVVPVDRIRRIT
jgi:hypothetical protein